MVSIAKKKQRNRTYYYARECKRVNGRPKIVWQKYLGRAEDIVAALSGASEAPPSPKPKAAIVTEFGAVAALFDLAQRLKLVEHVDRHVPKASDGPSVGTYLLAATINRCVAPCSKAGMGKWFQKTILRRLMDVEARQLSSQRYWDNMDRVSGEAMAGIERDFTTHLVKEFQIDLRRVLFDATNYFTHVDTFNERCDLAQRGKSKEGRKALRIIGLALLVSADSHVPLFHRTYPGNQPDSKTFASLTKELVSRYHDICESTEHVTLVLDKGNNSQDNVAALDKSPYHFVGSLVPTQHEDLLQIESSCFRSLAEDGLPTVRAHRLRKEVFGAERTVLVTYNENLFIAQSKTLLREVDKRRSKLRDEQTRLRRWRTGAVRRGKPPTVASVQKKVDGWLSARHMKELLLVEVTQEDEDLPALTYRFDKRGWERLQRTLLGKTILFTDNDDWSDIEIVRAYRGQFAVEEAFKRLKDPHHIALRPQYHWTDQKIEVHVFCCVMALTLCCLLRRELLKQGLDYSIPRLLDELQEIREVGVIYPPSAQGGDPVVETTLSEMSEEQQVLFDVLNLARYLAT